VPRESPAQGIGSFSAIRYIKTRTRFVAAEDRFMASTRLMRPATFKDGEEYLWVDRSGPLSKPGFAPVRFIGYCACPAFVIVRDGEEQNRRCLRDELFVFVP
jgi:hypothetical protein